MKASKARKELQKLVEQIDTLFPSLAGKSAADILCEKASAIKTLIALEAEEGETEQAAKITELTQQVTVSTAKIAELEKENAALKIAAATPRIERIPDPEHAIIREERDALQNIVTLLTSTLAEEAKAETAVRVLQSHPTVAETFCRLAKIDYRDLESYMAYSEINLRRLATGKDPKCNLVRAFLAVKYPAPVKPRATETFIPDTRSAEEKLRDAKASVRQSWHL